MPAGSTHAAGRGGKPPSRAAAAVSSRDMRSLESVISCICTAGTQMHSTQHSTVHHRRAV